MSTDEYVSLTETKRGTQAVRLTLESNLARESLTGHSRENLEWCLNLLDVIEDLAQKAFIGRE